MRPEIPLLKKTIVVTAEEYTIIQDALELFESKVSAKLRKTFRPQKRDKLKQIHNQLIDLITDMTEDEAIY